MNEKDKRQRVQNVRKLAVMAMLVAVSVVLVYLVHFPIIPAVAFLEYDPADIPILIGAFAYGPAAGILTPMFMTVPVDAVDALLLPAILPFNLIKAGVNSILTFLGYKTITRHIIHGEEWKKAEEEPEAEPLTAEPSSES